MFDLYECIKLFQRNACNTDSEYNKVTRIFNWITLYVPNVLKELYLIKVMCLLWERKFFRRGTRSIARISTVAFFHNNDKESSK